MTLAQLLRAQRQLCAEQHAAFTPTGLLTKVGYALGTEGLPLNGLRHPPAADTSGWYLWRGEELSQAPDFFSPLHAEHLVQRAPEALRFLGLPPGYRFLVAGNHVDIWYDAGLLQAA